ncbi:MAG: efflux RND transporter periplasmic adaptor subunit [Terrimicrobiaceae bacterium]|nr:efflux RND transporter periplasmic adaptor subunit [Terrimicrobiaceae bacterium]
MKKAALGLVVFSLALAGCRKPVIEEAPETTVLVAPVAERELQDFVVFTGRTDAVQTVAVRVRVSGYLMETKFRDGQEVKKGDVLFLIDPRPYQADLDRAQAEYDRAQADFQLAQIEFNRAKELRAKNTIAAQEFDAKAAALQRAQSSALAAKAAVDTAKLNLDFTRITAPIDGQTSRASVTPGNLITPDLRDPLTTIVSTKPVYAYADIDERQLLRYIRLYNEEHGGNPTPEQQPTTPIQLQLADEKGFPHEGVIDFSDNRVNPETGTITIRGVFEDKQNLLAPGMFVRLRFPGGPKYQALLVPQEAIGTDQGQKYVFVVAADGTVAYRRVEPGVLQDDGWRAVTGDLKAGENVIVEGLMKTRAGEKVKTQPWTGGQAP